MITRVLVAIVLMSASAEAANKYDVRLARQHNRQFENHAGITRMKWQTRMNRSRALLNFSQPFRLFNPIAWFF